MVFLSVIAIPCKHLIFFCSNIQCMLVILLGDLFPPWVLLQASGIFLLFMVYVGANAYSVCKKKHPNVYTIKQMSSVKRLQKILDFQIMVAVWSAKDKTGDEEDGSGSILVVTVSLFFICLRATEDWLIVKYCLLSSSFALNKAISILYCGLRLGCDICTFRPYLISANF